MRLIDEVKIRQLQAGGPGSGVYEHKKMMHDELMRKGFFKVRTGTYEHPNGAKMQIGKSGWQGKTPQGKFDQGESFDSLKDHVKSYSNNDYKGPGVQFSR